MTSPLKGIAPLIAIAWAQAAWSSENIVACAPQVVFAESVGSPQSALAELHAGTAGAIALNQPDISSAFRKGAGGPPAQGLPGLGAPLKLDGLAGGVRGGIAKTPQKGASNLALLQGMRRAQTIKAIVSGINAVPANPEGGDGDFSSNVKLQPALEPPNAARPPWDVAVAKNEQRVAACKKGRIDFLTSFSAAGSSVAAAGSYDRFIAWYYFGASTAQRDELEVRKVLAAARSYESACFESPNAADLPALKATLIFIGSSGSRLCTGIRVGADQILTARHCLMKNDASAGPVEMLSKKELDELWVEVPSASPARHRICEVRDPVASKPYSYSSDLALVRIAKPSSAGASVPVIDRMPKWNSRLVIPGLSLLADAAKEPFPVRVPIAEGCIVSATSDKCIFHGCQSLPGMSGSPIFFRGPAGKMLEQPLVGIHGGGHHPAYATEQCRMDPAISVRGSPNVGASVTTLTTKLGAQQ